jgi:CheY-like chemotaxis protein
MRDARVLVVDDHSIAASALSKQLSYLGLRVNSIGTSQEALQVLEAAYLTGDPYHIAIIDRWMPELNGVFLAKAIVQNRNIPDNTALIAMTPTTQTIDFELLKQAGYIASLFKPIRWTLMPDFLLKVWNKSGFGQTLSITTNPNSVRNILEIVLSATGLPLKAPIQCAIEHL